MKLFLLLTAATLLAIGCKKEAEISKKAVFIIVDGIPADVVEKVETPTLDEIAGETGYTRAYVGGEKGTYSETPTISAPGYMDLLTATWANKHNVWDNYEQSPNYHYHNIFRIAETADSTLKTAIFSTWLDNRTILVGEGKPGAGDFRIDYAFDGFEVDTVRFPHGNDSRYILAIDELVAEEAGRYIAEEAPDLSWVYLEYTDDIGHQSGDSEAFYESVRQADRQVKKIWDAVKKRQALGEDWIVVVTTDHGRDSITGRDHGGQSLRERSTWIATNADGLNSRFAEADPPIVDIAPSILAHLGIEIPEDIASEMDGTPFTGDLSFVNFQVALEGKTLKASWKPIHPEGKVQLLAAFANGFKMGVPDTYELLGEAPAAEGSFQITLNSGQLSRFAQSGVMKLQLKGSKNRSNRWIVGPLPPED